jgi:hypothetical protein
MSRLAGTTSDQRMWRSRRYAAWGWQRLRSSVPMRLQTITMNPTTMGLSNWFTTCGYQRGLRGDVPSPASVAIPPWPP